MVEMKAKIKMAAEFGEKLLEDNHEMPLTPNELS